VYLWSIQYYGNYPGGVRYDYLLQIYDRVITELDPRFRDAYVLGAAILSVEAHRPEDAIRLLDKGMRANPEDWMLPFEAGFVAYHDLRDYNRAASYFAIAIARPGVHPVVRRFHAEMFHRAGDRDTSRRYWEEILRTADTDYLRGVAARHVRDLTVEIDLANLRQAIEAYTRAHGSRPSELRDLVRGGELRALPVDPDGRPYAYDRDSGGVARSRGRSSP
jgi:tetratricopeptide (TPR) repeat protein